MSIIIDESFSTYVSNISLDYDYDLQHDTLILCFLNISDSII